LVKFKDSVEARVQQGALVSLTSKAPMADLQSIAANYGANYEQLLNGGACTNINALLGQAETRSGRAQPDLEGLHQVEFPPSLSGQQLLDLYDDLVVHSDVEFVELREASPGPPPTGGVTPDFSSGPPPSQTLYRGPNPGGDFDFANNLGLIGTGIRLAEVSIAFNFEHEEFLSGVVGVNASTPLQSYILNPTWDQWVDHGVATLSQNLAPNNGFGVTGMTHGADGQFYRGGVWTGTDIEFQIEEAFCNALADSIVAGDGQVVYLEFQVGTPGSWLAPLEVLSTIYMITVVGTDAGVVVLAPAGNGATNLDTSSVSLIQSWRARPDSGAIIVGAGSADSSHNRLSFSTFGSRVNLQGWGESVVAAGYGELAQVGGDINRAYTGIFSGTSSATPMVAGAAVLAQESALSLGIPALDSRQMRSFLAATGISQGTSITGNVGPFVDVRRAVTEVADADVSIASAQSGAIVTTTVTNHGPREAETIDVDIIFGGGTAYMLSPVNVSAGCQWNPNPPIPPGHSCLGQCPSLLECTFDDAGRGQQFIIQHEIQCGPNESFQIESDAALIGLLNDPVSANDGDQITALCSGQSSS